jgi:putative ABC transport system substrate-binding protein
MRRRDFIKVIGGTVAWPLAARAQQQEKIRRVGVLISLSASDPEMKGRLETFRKRLQELGWAEGNIRIDYRFAAGDATRLRADAAELVGSNPAVIVANGTAALRVLHQATRSIPIVFSQVVDPVSEGFVASLARPGGNVTGFTNFEYAMGAKWLELLKEIAPRTTKALFVFNPQTAFGQGYLGAAKSVGSFLRVESIPGPVHDAAQIEQSIASFAAQPNGGVVALPDPFVAVHRDVLVAAANRHLLPAIYPYRYFVTDGGLMSYGINTVELYRQVASYVDRVLRGDSPSNLPVQAPTKFEAIINLKTAKVLGLQPSDKLLATADEVIE